MTPLSLYIHIPWCERKCPYCDFNSHLAKTEINQAEYVAALLHDLDQDLNKYRELIAHRDIQTVFIGGGTPSLFEADSIAHLITGIRERITLASNAEITMEANPGSAEANRFKGYRSAGVNRLSIGVQSFNNTHLHALGRVHDQAAALAAADHARTAGFTNFNLDLMFGLPGQTQAQALEDLDQALALDPQHLSCYQLTIEPNTLFHHHPPVCPSDEAIWDMQLALQDRLQQADFHQYEVSAYAHDQHQCLHNLNYWQFGDYLGIGAGAHGKVSASTGEIQRYWKIKHPASYLKRCEQDGDPAGDRGQVSVEQIPFEFMLNALRLSQGYDTTLFEQRTGLPLNHITPILQRHQSLDLITFSNNRVQPTARGKTMIDSMLQDYLP